MEAWNWGLYLVSGFFLSGSVPLLHFLVTIKWATLPHHILSPGCFSPYSQLAMDWILRNHEPKYCRSFPPLCYGYWMGLDQFWAWPLFFLLFFSSVGDQEVHAIDLPQKLINDRPKYSWQNWNLLFSWYVKQWSVDTNHTKYPYLAPICALRTKSKAPLFTRQIFYHWAIFSSHGFLLFLTYDSRFHSAPLPASSQH